MTTSKATSLLQELQGYNEHQLRRLLVDHLTQQKLGLQWESNAIERDAALNANIVLPRLVPELAHRPPGVTAHGNLIIEGDNFDSLRLLKSTHAGKIRVIYIDPPYNTGNKDWVYNDHYVGAKDRWRHSQWLEFLYQRLTLARELLTSDGVILVSINDENRSRLELLMDEVFPGRRLGTITWRTRQGSNADQQCFLSVDHEHVLVYGNPGFSFNGFAKSYEMYGNPDKDPRGDWRSDNLTLGFSYKERPNLYYPLVDKLTNIVYPPNPDRVWVYATESRLKEGQTVQTKTMEEFIHLKQIIFPGPDQRVSTWETMDDLLAAIDSGDVPKSGKTPLLRRDLPNLTFWVGKRVGFGRPQFKRYKADLRNQTQPLSSWIVPQFEEGDYEAENNLVSATNQEGARQIAKIFGDRAFNYAKPFSLIEGLLAQATRPGDTVLDFFAGSATTGHAVLTLNAQDGGKRRFILCSSTETTTQEPNKNLCRDVCAERMRRVIQNEGYSASFAYLQMDRVEAADLDFEATPQHAALLTALRETGFVPAESSNAPLQVVAKGSDWLTVFCAKATPKAMNELAALPARHGVARLVVYGPRPKAMAELLQERGIEAVTYSITDALLKGQISSLRNLAPDAQTDTQNNATATQEVQA
jgi:adenine-specific DNA-methyltransferase